MGCSEELKDRNAIEAWLMTFQREFWNPLKTIWGLFDILNFKTVWFWSAGAEISAVIQRVKPLK